MTGGVRCGGGIGIALALSVTMGWGAPQTSLTAGRMRVAATADRISVSLEGVERFAFPARVAVDTEEGGADRDLFEPAFRQEAGRCVWTSRTTNWEKKEVTLSVEGGAAVLRVTVQGKGKLGKLRFFPQTDRTGPLAYEVSRYLLPVALGGSRCVPQWRNTMESAGIELGYMTPPLLAFPFVGTFRGSCAVGLAPKPGAYHVDHFRCEFAAFREGLFSTDFLGYTEVQGEYELPALIMTAGEDAFDALSAYSEWLYREGGCRRIERTQVPRWWLGPFFCGWGEQGYHSPTNVYAGANQKAYAAMSERLDAFGLKPSAIIVDDKWQRRYGELLPDPVKWPDMRAFVEAEHAKGRRVLLWLKAWDNEGLSSEECVKCLCTPYGADPTSPTYRRRIQETMRRLLSAEPGCFNCDGFKIDFANCMPLGRNLATHERNVYGIELLKRLMTLFYESAKAVKPDCLINNSCCHPYFAEVTDQCRLHDYNGQLRSLWEVREFRARLFKTAFPGISVDTDDPHSTSHAEMMNYLRRAPDLGVPDLYQLHRRIRDEDLREIAGIWEAYSARLEKSVDSKGGKR
ncbi:MAG TPA: hypothetical protein P5125_07700 [Kiritimatiellia bacterium]|nr:hypothetical protein [Kiritimatiellia bacterium]HOM58490.1 hypothetical protein [Kiritimatiellia bacterium]HOR97764.1 hypothetical protein [Kiritimatiellia bacterium]HRU20225.1 hypothetical protein [Kiritimatiellia bacterium]